MSSPEFNPELLAPLMDEMLTALASVTTVTAHADADDWSKIIVNGATKRYSLYLRDVQELDAPTAV
jgi:hypothetical protein